MYRQYRTTRMTRESWLNFRHQFGEFDFPAVADSGTTRTIIAMDLVKRHKIKLYSTKKQLRNASEDSMRCEGRIPITINGVPTMALASSSLNNEILLSLRDMRKLGIVDENFPALPVRVIKQDVENF